MEILASAQQKEHRDLGSGSAKRVSRSRLQLSQESIEISAPAQPREHRDLGSGSSIEISAPAQPKEHRDLGSDSSIEISAPAQPSGMSRLRLSGENFAW